MFKSFNDIKVGMEVKVVKSIKNNSYKLEFIGKTGTVTRIDNTGEFRILLDISNSWLWSYEELKPVVENTPTSLTKEDLKEGMKVKVCELIEGSTKYNETVGEIGTVTRVGVGSYPISVTFDKVIAGRDTDFQWNYKPEELEIVEEEPVFKPKREVFDSQGSYFIVNDPVVVCVGIHPSGFKAKGVARCEAHDEFNETIGKNIAYRRALQQITEYELDMLCKGKAEQGKVNIFNI